MQSYTTMLLRFIEINIHIFFFSGLLCTAHAQLSVNSVFSNNAIIQQDQPIKIWGKDAPGNTVMCAIAGASTQSFVTEDSLWYIEFDNNLQFEEEYTMLVKSQSDEILITGLVLGDVWLATGQSNMEVSIRNRFTLLDSIGFIEYLDTLLLDNFNNFRMFNIGSKKSSTEDRFLEEANGNDQSWLKMDVFQVIREQSAVAYYFGRHLHKKLGHPVGIIVAATGGTKIEEWSPKETFGNSFMGNELDASYFNGMISPLIPTSISGVIFYQGESNRANPDFYAEKSVACFNSWQNRWANKFPVFTTLLAGFKDMRFAHIRNEQILAEQKIENLYLASAFDLGEYENIHPKQKKLVGERLATKVLSDFYRKPDIRSEYPRIKHSFIKGDSLIISIANYEGLNSNYNAVPNRLIKIFDSKNVEIKATKVFLADSLILVYPISENYYFFEYNQVGFSENHLYAQGLPMHPYSSLFDTTFVYDYNYEPFEYEIQDLILCQSDGSARLLIDTLANRVVFSNVNTDVAYLQSVICPGDSVEVGYKYFSNAGDYQVLLKNSLGCDSLINLSIGLLSTDTTYINELICLGDSLQVGTEMFYESGAHQVILSNAAGCDSLVNLTIEHLRSDTTDLNQSICPGDSVEVGFKYFSNAGDYQVLLRNSLGCDSLINLNLEVCLINGDLQNRKFHVYPNPVSDLINLSIKVERVILYSMDFKIFEVYYDTDQLQIEGFNSGVLIIQVELFDGSVFSERIIKL